MKFSFPKPRLNIVYLARRLGYRPLKFKGAELHCRRSLAGNNYPRFHLFIKEDKDRNALIFSLHLDQKRVCYKGSPAHSGEYDSRVVKQEAERIKQMMSKLG